MISSVKAPGQWGKLISDCLESLLRDQVGEACPVVDYELVSPANRASDDTQVWFILRTEKDKGYFREIELVRNRAKLTKKMLAAGIPEDAVAALRIRITSREEIQKAAGRFDFSR